MATNNAINKKSDSITFDGTNILSSYTAVTAWTPDLQFGGAKVGITYSAQVGYYSRIANMIFFSGYINLSSKGSSTGAAALYGLPTSASQHQRVGCWGGYNTYTGEGLHGYIASGNAYIEIRIGSQAGGDIITLTDAEMSNSSMLRVSGFYFV